LLAATALLAAPAGPADDLAAQIAAAQRAYDVQAAEAAQTAARALTATEPLAEGVMLRIKACLLVAELYRIDWEKLAESDIVHRRAIGGKIDDAVEEALSLYDQLPENSEKNRLKADLLGTMIRSDFRAKKYKKPMDEATARALALDPNNARAYVTQSKPFLFAPKNEGGDPAKAVDILTTALKLDPTLESARCLRGLAYKKAGQPALAKQDFQTALDQNPECRPAKEQLAELKG
jgi:tetratricopeptide (TPR) repeat protein